MRRHRPSRRSIPRDTADAANRSRRYGDERRAARMAEHYPRHYGVLLRDPDGHSVEAIYHGH